MLSDPKELIFQMILKSFPRYVLPKLSDHIGTSFIHNLKNIHGNIPFTNENIFPMKQKYFKMYKFSNHNTEFGSGFF